MIESKKIDKINKGLFLLALFCIIFRKYIEIFVDKDVPLGRTSSLLLYGSMGLFLIQFLINKNRNKNGIFFLAIAGVLYVITRDGSILAMMLLALAMEVVGDRFSIKSYFSIHVLLFIGGMIFAVVYPDLAHRQEIHYRIVDGYNYARYSFGAGNPNAVFYLLLPVYAAYIFFRFKKYNIWDRLILLATMYVIYTNTDSRTGLLSIVACLLVVEILKRVDIKENKLFKSCISLFPIFITLVTVVLAVFFYNNKVLIKLLSSRTKYWHTYIQGQGKLFTLFGNDYSAAMKIENPLDSSYIYIIAMLGMVSLILILYVLSKALYEHCKNDNKEKIVVILMFLIFGFGENMLLEAAINFSLAMAIKDVMILDGENVNIYKYPFDILKSVKNRRKV